MRNELWVKSRDYNGYILISISSSSTNRFKMHGKRLKHVLSDESVFCMNYVGERFSVCHNVHTERTDSCLFWCCKFNFVD